jgi:hypothetical protein
MRWNFFGAGKFAGGWRKYFCWKLIEFDKDETEEVEENWMKFDKV